ncbi:MAG: hypothetical protein JEZ12_28455 [Desulfobacterium sp.]|nr:hypothetical protein [Desulfobacterium sp.]
MITTSLESSQSNLISLAVDICKPETLELMATEIDDCKTMDERIKWIMECYFTHDQPFAIVKIRKTGTWGLIPEPNGDDTEYTDRLNGNEILDWFE